MKPPLHPKRGGEDHLIDWLQRRIRRQSGATSIGDDAAILPPDAYAVTVDHQIAGVHFPLDAAPAVVARRLLAVNLSDLAAMGAVHAHAFLALAAPEGFDHRKFFAALLGACARFGVELAGGDLARSPERLSASLTLLGTKAGERWVERGGARPGHALWVGGTLGESAAGRLVIERGPVQGQPKEAFSSRTLEAGRAARGQAPSRAAPSARARPLAGKSDRRRRDRHLRRPGARSPPPLPRERHGRRGRCRGVAIRRGFRAALYRARRRSAHARLERRRGLRFVVHPAGRDPAAAGARRAAHRPDHAAAWHLAAARGDARDAAGCRMGSSDRIHWAKSKTPAVTPGLLTEDGSSAPGAERSINGRAWSGCRPGP